MNAIGRSAADRYVFVVFTLQQTDGHTRLWPISARYIHKGTSIFHPIWVRKAYPFHSGPTRC